MTPAYVLTAGHCVVGAGKCWLDPLAEGEPLNTSQDDARIVFRSNAGTDFHTVGPAGVHTYINPYTNQPNAIDSLIQHPVDQCVDNDAARDLALIQLDERIPMADVYPLHVPLFKDSCRDKLDMDGFTARLVGFGGYEAFSHKRRAWRQSSGWEREGAGNAALYQNAWFALGGHDGMSESGDSGGPLIHGGNTASPQTPASIESSTLCAVVSGRVPGLQWHCVAPYVCVPEPVIWNNTATVDSSAAESFIQERIVDAYGNFIGECNSGPVAKRDVDSDQDLIPDACDPCPTLRDPVYRVTGRFAEYDPATGANPEYYDGDNDGVPDGCDNCPRDQNGYDDDHEQGDRDFDGLGDACDLCDDQIPAPYSDLTCCKDAEDCPGSGICVQAVVDGHGAHCLNAGFTGRCAGSLDRDYDRVGDLCDNCPKDKQLNQDQTDTDGDGVGDLCDTCAGDHPYGHQAADQAPSCSFVYNGDLDDAYCRTITQDNDSVCTYLGACTGGRDQDGDEIGDACDGCPHDKNPYKSQLHSNCNIDVEIVTGSYPYRTDECDPNPCTAADSMETAATGNPYDIGNPASGKLWAEVKYYTGILPNGHPDAYPYFQPGGTLTPGATPTATVGARFCSCKAEDVPAGFTAMGCHMEGYCPIVPGLYGASASEWAVPELVDQTSGGPWPPAEPGQPGHVPLEPGAEVSGLGMHSTNHDPSVPAAPELLPSGSVSGVVAMNLSTFEGFDIVPGDLPGLGVEGVLWTQTRAVTGIPHTAFQPWSNWYQASFFGKSASDIPDPEQLPETSCGPLCEASCKMCNMLDEIANLVLSRINPVDVRVFAVTRHGTEDMTDTLSTSVRSALTDADLQWVNAAEHGPWQGSSTPLFAAVSPDMSSVPLVAAYRHGKVVPARGRLTDDEVPFEAMGILDAPVHLTTPPDSGRVGAAAVLSATEKAVFVVGGRTQ
ncbi:MAG: hypothetical protein ACOC1F_11230, partial [Myxococcota bacterium]